MISSINNTNSSSMQFRGGFGSKIKQKVGEKLLDLVSPADLVTLSSKEKSGDSQTTRRFVTSSIPRVARMSYEDALFRKNLAELEMKNKAKK